MFRLSGLKVLKQEAVRTLTNLRDTKWTISTIVKVKDSLYLQVLDHTFTMNITWSNYE